MFRWYACKISTKRGKPNDLKSMVRRYLPEYGNYEKQDAFDKIPWDKKS